MKSVRQVTLHAEEQQRQITEVLERVEAYASQVSQRMVGGLRCKVGNVTMVVNGVITVLITPINGRKYKGNYGLQPL